MSFFSRPNLDDVQFKQLSGDTLTLSGKTKIASVTGLQLYNGVDGYVPINLNGAGVDSNNFSLVYDHSVNSVVLRNVSGGTAIYEGNPVSTIKLGGVEEGTTLTGRTLTSIIEELLTPPVEISVSAPSHTLSIIPSTSIYEVGVNISITRCVVFNRGVVSPVFDENGIEQTPSSQQIRAGQATAYSFAGSTHCQDTISSTAPTYSDSISFGVLEGNNHIRNIVCFSEGQPIYNNVCCVVCTPLAASNTPQQSLTIRGVFPWFYGKTSSAPDMPVDAQTLINDFSICKCVQCSVNPIVATAYCADDEYLWFAIPAAYGCKTCWQGSNNVSNAGAIPGALFGDYVLANINSPDTNWNNISYRFYVSNYATNTFDGVQNYCMTFCN